MGDSIGQVSSQTLKNMSVIDEISQGLVLRPLAGLNKQDIINTAKHIGTYEFAASMPEYCGVVSDKPSIWASLEEITEAEWDIFQPLVAKALEQKKVVKVSEISWQIPEDIPEISEVWDYQIIDIRTKERIESSPLSQKWISQEVIEIPFYEINHMFEKLDQKNHYGLYCDSGVLSHLHGLYLREKGFENIVVLRV